MIVKVGCAAGRLGSAAPSATKTPGAPTNSPWVDVAAAALPPMGKVPARWASAPGWRTTVDPGALTAPSSNNRRLK